MNKKQCQKCGEENPPEAVMCWACYTPLGSGAAAAASTPARSSAAKDDNDKKTAIAPWQMGVIGAALLVGAVMGVRTLLPSGDEYPTGDQTAAPKTRPRPGGGGGGAAPPPDPLTTSGTASTVQLPPPPQVQANVSLLRVEVPPNPKFDVATVGIVPTEQNVSEYKAASLAVLAHRNIVNAKRWRRIQIYVFNDEEAAKMFREYQRKRRGAPLEIDNYRALTELWRRTPAVYEFYGQHERWASPSKSPTDWWDRWPDWGQRST